jgi:hypothetical protein
MRESPGDDECLLNRTFLLMLARPVQPEESKRLLEYLEQQQKLFEEDDAAMHGEPMPESLIRAKKSATGD